MRRWWQVCAIIVVAACGRIRFDPLGGADANNSNGDASGSGSGMAAPAGGETCASAVDLPLGSTGTVTFTGTSNDFGTPGGCPNGVEIVYKVTQVSTTFHQVYLKPTFNATLSITNACPPAGGSCQTVIQNQTYNQSVQFQAGTMYITIDKTNTAGTTFDIQLQ